LSEVADRFVVILDANVLYPFRVRDVLLSFAEAGLYRARWSSEILDEWTENLIANKPHLEDSVKSQRDAMSLAFPEAMVEGYEGLVQALELPDPNDRHVLAAAIRAGAQTIVTENIKDFPSEVIGQYDVTAVTADAFISSTFELYDSEAIAALRSVRQKYQRPAMGPSEFLMSLMSVGLARTAALARPHSEAL